MQKGISKAKNSINILLKIKENTGQQFVDVSCEQMIITSYPATFHAVHYIRMSLVVAIVSMITWLYYSLLDSHPPSLPRPLPCLAQETDDAPPLPLMARLWQQSLGALISH